jgi:cytochrome c oxidase subunit 2
MVVLMTLARWSTRLTGLAALLAVVTVQALPAQDRRVVRVKAERFAFSPSEITMTAGEEIEIRLKSDDTTHGFRIVGTDVNVEIPKRGQGEVKVIFKGDKAGRYEFECSHLCGAGHAFMRGVIVVKAKS